MAITISTQRQLFLDDRFIDINERVVQRMNRPRLVDVALAPGPEGSPDDAMVGAYGQVEEDGGIFKMWVNARAAKVLMANPETGAGRHAIPTQLATSTDGIHWERPCLNLIDWDGSCANNLVCPDWGLVLIDPIAPPDARYKLLHTGQVALGARNVQESMDPRIGGLYFYTSPDGIHWTFNPTRVFDLYPDCLNQVIYDTRLEKYVAYLRSWPDGCLRNRAHGRTISRIEIDNLMDPWPYTPLDTPRYLWGKDKIAAISKELPVVMAYPGYTEEGCWTDIYDPHVVQYRWAENAYFAFPELNHQRLESTIPNHSVVDIGMCVSPDGMTWTWPSTDPYIPLEEQGHGRGGMLYNLTGILRVGDQIYQYHMATDIEHHGQVGEVYGYNGLLNTGRIYRTVQRLDGFVSIDFPAAGGTIVTPPLEYSGSRLVLNVDAGNGEGRVELRSADGTPLPGFTFADCDPIRDDATARVITWHGTADIAKFHQEGIRCAWHFFNAKLYAWQIAE